MYIKLLKRNVHYISHLKKSKWWKCRFRNTGTEYSDWFHGRMENRERERDQDGGTWIEDREKFCE